MEKTNGLRWILFSIQYFILLLGCTLFLIVRPYNDLWYIMIVLLLHFINVKIQLYIWRQMAERMLLEEFALSKLNRIVCAIPGWQKNRSALAYSAVSLWMQGDFEGAYLCLDRLSSDFGGNPGLSHFENLIRGWDDYRREDRESLKKRLMLEILGQSKRMEAGGESGFVRIMSIWSDLLESGIASDIEDFDPEQSNPGLNTMIAYWYGIWYSEKGDTENAIKQFQAVWRYGRDTQIAENAKSWLLYQGELLPEQYPYEDRALLSMFQKSVICLLVLILLLALFFLIL